MTKNECAEAIGLVFPNTEITHGNESWCFIVDANPKREIVFTDAFLKQRIESGEMTKESLSEYISNEPERCWSLNKDGSKTLVLNVE